MTYSPETHSEKVIEAFDFSKVPHVFSEEDTKSFAKSLLIEVIWLARRNPMEFCEVSMDNWVAQAIETEEDGTLVSLMYTTESATAVYLDGAYV